MRSRQGFSLVELLVVTVIGSLVLSAIYQTLTMQERTNRHQYAIISTQQTTRAALEVLTGDLREVSALDGDIVQADSVSIHYRALRKAGLVCARDEFGAWADLAIYGEPFETTDSVVVFQDGANDQSSSDDSWAPLQITGVADGSCPGVPVGDTIQRLQFPANTLMQVDTGGLIRSFTPVGYRLVDEGEGGTLYRMEAADSFALIEHLSSIANRGLRLKYYDANGLQISNPSSDPLRESIMRVEVLVSGRAIGGGTGAARAFVDSLRSQVYLRGNFRNQ